MGRQNLASKMPEMLQYQVMSHTWNKEEYTRCCTRNEEKLGWKMEC
jgi:hypothetical protein